jgi:hypothetical protein
MAVRELLISAVSSSAGCGSTLLLSMRSSNRQVTLSSRTGTL